MLIKYNVWCTRHHVRNWLGRHCFGLCLCSSSWVGVATQTPTGVAHLCLVLINVASEGTITWTPASHCTVSWAVDHATYFFSMDSTPCSWTNSLVSLPRSPRPVWGFAFRCSPAVEFSCSKPSTLPGPFMLNPFLRWSVLHCYLSCLVCTVHL